jgi:uncharacterized OB-fold protein
MTTDKDTTMEQVTRPVPDRTELDEHWYQALSEGRLIFQRTPVNAWLPPRLEDPVSLSPEWEWAQASGQAKLVSWVTYHISYHPYFEDKIPYKVATVELAEGPRMLAPLELGDVEPRIDLPLTVDIVFDGGQWIPVFRPTGDSAS